MSQSVKIINHIVDSLLLGDMVFISFYKSHKGILLWPNLFKRLKLHTENHFKKTFPFSEQQLLKELESIPPNVRVKFSIFPINNYKGLKRIGEIQWGCHIKWYPYEQKELDAIDLKITPYDHFSPNKLGSYGHRIARISKKKSEDNLYCYNSEIIESSTSHIYFIKDKKIFTPLLYPHHFQGISREILLQHLPNCGYQVFQQRIMLDQLELFTSAFICNSLSGPRAVRSVKDFWKSSDDTNAEVSALYKIWFNLLDEEKR